MDTTTPAPPAPTLLDALSNLRSTFAFSSLDTASDPTVAWVSGIISGWGCEKHHEDAAHVHDWLCGDEYDSLEILAETWNWNEAKVAQAKALRTAVRDATQNFHP